MPRLLDRQRLEKMIEEGVASVSLGVRMRPEDALILDDIAQREFRTRSNLIASLAREYIEKHWPWGWPQ